MFDLKIHNYRSFQNQNFEFSRVNILIGENSGGKSSLLKFLLSLKQTLDSPQESNLKLKGDYTDLGNFEEVIYNRDKEKNLEFEFSDNKKYPDFFAKIINDLDKKPDKKTLEKIINIIQPFQTVPTNIKFRLSHKLDEHQSIKTIFSNTAIGTLEIVQKKRKYDDYYREFYCNLKFKFKNHEGTLKNCLCYKEGFFTLLNPELKKKIEESYPDNEAELIYYSIVYLLMFQNYINDQIERIRFVNPIGNSPKRFYFQEDKKSSYKLIDIEKFINVLGDSSLSKKEYEERIELMNKTIKEFGIAEEIEIVKNKELPILALNVKTKDFWSNITDVGYGVSLQIPILFQALLSENYTKKGQTILIEQPEVHLHPKLQAKFIETLLSIGNKNSYFIETHSEHIVRKLQVLVKNKSFGLKPEDISIYYFKRSTEKFEISSHRILSDGKLSVNFPDGFYDTSYSLVKELL